MLSMMIVVLQGFAIVRVSIIMTEVSGFTSMRSKTD